MNQSDDVVPLPPVVKIRHLYVGEIETLGYTKGGKELRSGINKREILEGRVKVTNLGLEGDHIDKKEFHGGPERVVHQFAQEDYPLLVSFIQSHSSTSPSEANLDPSLFHAGRFGENLSTDPGMNEKNVCIGDIYRAGLSEEESEDDVILKVTQPRKPCYQLNHRFQYPKVSELSERACMTGWFYSILKEGELKVGQSLFLKHRPSTQFTLHRVHELLSNYSKTSDVPLSDQVKEELRVLGAFEDLSLNWRLVAEKILTGETAKWDPSIRLYGGENAFPSGKEEDSAIPSSFASTSASSSASSIPATATVVNSCCGAQQKVIIGSVVVLSIIGLVVFLRKKN